MGLFVVSDMTGQPQGPFQKEQLQQWRAHFPMNTLLWKTEQMNSEREEDKSTKKATFLADILGDDTLLRRWQIETPNSVTSQPHTTSIDSNAMFCQ